ncbi:MAG: hypothetical protein P8P30_04510 [Rickettsiales bacterium]|nr:hypothetical protein [Rickettsiales bacterium]
MVDSQTAEQGKKTSEAAGSFFTTVFTTWGKASKGVLRNKKTRDNVYKVLEDSELLTAFLGPKIAGAADTVKMFLGTDTDAILAEGGITGKTGAKLLNDGATAGSKQFGYYVARNYLGLKDPAMAERVGGMIGTMVGGHISKMIFNKLGIPDSKKDEIIADTAVETAPTAETTPTAEEIGKAAVAKHIADEEAKEAEAKAKEEVVAKEEAHEKLKKTLTAREKTISELRVQVASLNEEAVAQQKKPVGEVADPLQAFGGYTTNSSGDNPDVNIVFEENETKTLDADGDTKAYQAKNTNSTDNVMGKLFESSGLTNSMGNLAFNYETTTTDALFTHAGSEGKTSDRVEVIIDGSAVGKQSGIRRD